MKNALTQSRLKELLHYEPQTGIFTRLAAGPRAQRFVGTACGRLHKKRGYREISVDGELYYAHRLAWLYMTGQWPEQEIDHRNHDRDDNRWENLRDVSTSANQLNRAADHGVSLYRKGNYVRWRARVTIAGREHSLGYFRNRADAVVARSAATAQHKQGVLQ